LKFIDSFLKMITSPRGDEQQHETVRQCLYEYGRNTDYTPVEIMKQETNQDAR
jgi:hypothetical protein